MTPQHAVCAAFLTPTFHRRRQGLCSLTSSRVLTHLSPTLPRVMGNMGASEAGRGLFERRDAKRGDFCVMWCQIIGDSLNCWILEVTASEGGGSLWMFLTVHFPNCHCSHQFSCSSLFSVFWRGPHLALVQSDTQSQLIEDNRPRMIRLQRRQVPGPPDFNQDSVLEIFFLPLEKFAVKVL